MTPESAAAILEAAAAAIAIVRLFSLGLARDLPALLSFLILTCASAAAASALPLASPAYFWLYIVQTPLYCVLAILAVRELFKVVFADYPGIRTAGRMAISWCALLACLIAALFAMARRPNPSSAALAAIELFRRSAALSVALFILFLLYSLSRYPLHLRRNIVISTGMFSILFLSQAAQLLIDSFSWLLYHKEVDLANEFFSALCMGAWAALLRAEPARAGKAGGAAAHEEQLLANLESLDRLLTRAARQ